MALRLDRVSVMVVDDNAHMRALLRDILHGFCVGTVIERSDGSEALAELRRQPADIVFVDWMMAPLDGLEFTRLVRTASDSPNPFLPIVMLTGHTERGRIMEARDAGATEFLAKPVTPLSLYSRIRAVIETPRPFVRVGGYMGPCRRRKLQDFAGAGRREEDRRPPRTAAQDAHDRAALGALVHEVGEL